MFFVLVAGIEQPVGLVRGLARKSNFLIFLGIVFLNNRWSFFYHRRMMPSRQKLSNELKIEQLWRKMNVSAAPRQISGNNLDMSSETIPHCVSTLSKQTFCPLNYFWFSSNLSRPCVCRRPSRHSSLLLLWRIRERPCPVSATSSPASYRINE